MLFISNTFGKLLKQKLALVYFQESSQQSQSDGETDEEGEKEEPDEERDEDMEEGEIIENNTADGEICNNPTKIPLQKSNSV